MSTTVTKSLAFVCLLVVTSAFKNPITGSDCVLTSCDYEFHFCNGPTSVATCTKKIYNGMKCRAADQYGTKHQTCMSGICNTNLDVCQPGPSENFHDPAINCNGVQCSKEDPCDGNWANCTVIPNNMDAIHNSPWGNTCAKMLQNDKVTYGCDKGICALWTPEDEDDKCCVVPDNAREGSTGWYARGGEKIVCQKDGGEIADGYSSGSDFNDCTEPCVAVQDNSASAVGPSLVILALFAIFN